MRVPTALVRHPGHVAVGTLGQKLAQATFGERRGIWRCYLHGVEAVFARGLTQRRLDPSWVGQKSRSA